MKKVNKRIRKSMREVWLLSLKKVCITISSYYLILTVYIQVLFVNITYVLVSLIDLKCLYLNITKVRKTKKMIKIKQSNNKKCKKKFLLKNKNMMTMLKYHHLQKNYVLFKIGDFYRI